jgi:zinc transporter
LKSASDLPASARELLIAADEHQQFHASEDCLYGVFADLVCMLDGVTEEIGYLHFVMTERVLVSGRRRMLNTAKETCKALRNGHKVSGPAALLDMMVEHIVDAVDHYADDFARKLDHIEERILADHLGEGVQSLGRIRLTAVRLHRQLASLRSLIHRFQLDRGQPSNPALRLETARLSQRLDWLDTEIVALRDRAHLLQEEVTIKTAGQTNRNLHVLAIVTTIFLPASLVAGIFGMNVGGLPLIHSEHGFLWSIVLLAGASAIVIWLLRRSGVLRR